MKHTNQQATPHYESSRLPYVCWYQNDFLGGVRGMRAHEIGIYTILLNEMYARGRPLELSVERLARLCGCDKRTFINVLEMLIEEGKILNLANGLWNKRCENVFQERTKLLEQKSFAGHSSAKKRKKINTEIQQLLNKCGRDDKQNSESQKEEEKETPNGVSQKQFFLIETKKERNSETTCANLWSAPIFNESSSLTPSKQDEIESLPTTLPNRESSPHTPGDLNKPMRFPANTKNASSSTDLIPSPTDQTPASCSKAQRRTAIPKGQRLPADWQADIESAVLEGLSEEQARWQEKKFRDYWHAKSGKEALKVDWQATWRNWFRREIERLKEHQERLAIFSSPGRLSPPNSENDALYRSLINYHTN
ncbi:DUF1376 domain-containing protein [Bartonella alsatica]|uniref:Uncharacterized protein n=3 Tax=Bartonella TaxID=773 RepID=J1IRX4_9HYPH|nr:DUF1376 domain-containing protein [Bartonella alsatica]EJF74292.1 hypothetical protein MEC_01320 [Bartonella alsatica IBS 382]QLC51876.1 DUF1376 domain-containing protein [Bartonella alsatica]